MNNELNQLNAYDTNILQNQETYGDVSNRYIQIPTTQIIAEMQKEHDFKVIDFSRANVRKQEKHGKQKHLVMLQAPGSEMLDGTNLRIVLYNSSDRSSAIKLFTGAIRWACANNLVFSETGGTVDPAMSIRHTQKDWKHSIASLMDNYNEIQNQTNEMIKRMMNSYLSYGDQGRLAEAVAAEFGPEITGDIIDPYQFNISQRPEDSGKDAWHTFNRIQSNLINGGISRIVESTDEDTQKIITTTSNTHKVTDNRKQINWNQRLHKLVLETIN